MPFDFLGFFLGMRINKVLLDLLATHFVEHVFKDHFGSFRASHHASVASVQRSLLVQYALWAFAHLHQITRSFIGANGAALLLINVQWGTIFLA